MEITSIQIEPSTHPEAKVMATAQVVLNGSLSLRGIKILRGRYGLFLAFPGLSAGSPYRAFETLSMRFRKELQEEVLRAYRNMLATPLPLFG
ncbi:MAG: SpoVG [Fibrobacteres bacterium]|nr:SpoVG [Fibrobacterota bacterium]